MNKAIDSKPQERIAPPYMQNRELSWLTFNERVLDQGADPHVPLLERLQFVSIFSSNLQEFMMVRVGSLTDLNLLKKEILDSKTLMTAGEQLDAIHVRCHELYPYQEETYHKVLAGLAEAGVKQLTPDELNDEQRAFLETYAEANIRPFLAPQIINARHPFPHLETGSLYVLVRLDDEAEKNVSTKTSKNGKKAKNQGAETAFFGLIPMPPQCARMIKLPGEGTQFILLEQVIKMLAPDVFNMYQVKHINVICVTRNADIDTTDAADSLENDYREHMKKILKKRARLAPVRLESEVELSKVAKEFLLNQLNLKEHQCYVTSVPLDMGYAFALPDLVDEDTRAKLTSRPWEPQWPAVFNKNRSIIEQVRTKKELLLTYPYEDINAFVKLLREAAVDPNVISIKITLYRLASHSLIAQALCDAAENGKDVTALFELRARFDEKNNIEWAERFEKAGCKVIYGFHNYKVHSKICAITLRNPETGNIEYITQLGTGNYNEKTSRLYTDMSFFTTNTRIGADANIFFNNMGLENASTEYVTLSVAPLQIKPQLMKKIDEQIALAREGKPCGIFLKTNSTTDKEIIEKIVEASQAGVHVMMLVRGISCLLPGVPGYTDNVRVFSIVGRLLEHSRIFGFGPVGEMQFYLSSADLMTRNMDKRIEIAWPIPMTNETITRRLAEYIDVCLKDNVKLRELKPDGTYTPLYALHVEGEPLLDSQDYLITKAYEAAEKAAKIYAAEDAANDVYASMPMGAASAGNPPADKAAVTLDAHMVPLEEGMTPENAALDSEPAPATPAPEIAAETIVEPQGTPAPALATEPAPAEAKAEEPAAAPAAEEKPTEAAPEAEAKPAEAPAEAPAEEPKAEAAAPKQPAKPAKKKGFFARLFGW